MVWFPLIEELIFLLLWPKYFEVSTSLSNWLCKIWVHTLGLSHERLMPVREFSYLQYTPPAPPKGTTHL